MLVISQDLDEIFEIADRIAVISRRPAVAGRCRRETMTLEQIGLLMGGCTSAAACGIELGRSGRSAREPMLRCALAAASPSR